MLANHGGADTADAVVVADDLGGALDGHARELLVVLAGLDQGADPRVALEVLDLLRRRVGPEADPAVDN